MTNYKQLAELMSKAIVDDVLPDIAFTDNTAQLVGTSVEHLTVANMNSQEFLATSKNVVTAIKEYESLTENVADHYHDLMPIKDVADAFAKKLNVGIKSLSNIKKIVSKLTAEVMQLAEAKMVEDPTIAVTLESLEEPSIKFDKINWEKLDVVDERFTFNKLNSTIGVTKDKPITKNLVQILIDRLPYGTNYNRANLEDLKINKEAAKATFDAVYKKIGNVLPAKDVKYVLSMLLDLDDFKCLSAVNTFREVLDNPIKINSLLQMVNDFSIVLNAVNENTLKFSAATKKELLARKEILDKYIDMATYMCTYYRSIVWKDAIMVPGNRLNPDNWTTYRKKGGSSICLAHHNAFFHSDKEIPSTGVSVNFVLENKTRVLTAAKEEASINIVEITNKKKDIIRNAFIYQATDWLKKNKSKWTPEFSHGNNPSVFAMSIYDSAVDAPLESSFYKVILNSCCTNTIVNKLYQNLSDMYFKHVKVGGELTKAQCEALDMTVYANMITDFVINQKMITL